MSDSEAYLHDEVVRTYKDWGYISSNVKTIQEWRHSIVGSSVSLFGDVSMVHLDLSDANDLKKFVTLISDKVEAEKFKKEGWFGPGLIITSTVARGAKKIENLVTASNGVVAKKEKPEQMRKILLGRLRLNPSSKEFLEAYVGDDYEMLISITNQLESMSEDDQYGMTPERLIVRLPTKPGAVPPWEFVNPMLEGNAREAVSLFQRAIVSTHILVPMKIVRGKLQLLYRLKVLIDAGVWNSKEQAQILGESNGPNIWITAKAAKGISLETAEYVAKLSLVTEANLKGHSRADVNTLFENFIAAVCIAIKNDTPLPLEIR